MRLDHFNGTARHRDGSRRRDLFDRNHGRLSTSRVQGSRLVPRCRRLAVSRRLFPLAPPRVAVSRLRGPIHVTTMNSIHDIGSSPHCLSSHVYKSVCRSVEGGRASLVLRARGRSSGRLCAAAADGCRSRSRTTARQNGHGVSFRGGLVARTSVMHSRQKLWLHGVVTRSLYGSRQMMHSPPSDCGRTPVGWGGVAWSVRELAGGCARTVGVGAAAGGARPCAAAAWGPSGMIQPGDCRSRSRTPARQNGHGVSFRRGLVAMTRVMHSRQKLWLHSVMTRSRYGSRQMEHWRGEVRVGELVEGCARTDGRRHLDGRRRLGRGPQPGVLRAAKHLCDGLCRFRRRGGGRRRGRRRGGRRAGLGAAAVSPPPAHPKQITLSKKVAIIGPQRVLSSNHLKIMATFAVAKENRRDLSYALRDARRLAHHCPTFYKLPHARGGSFFGRGRLPAAWRLRSHALYFIKWSHTAAAKADGGRVDFVALYFLNPKHTAAAQGEAGKDKGDEDHCSHHGRVIIIIIIMGRLGGLVSWTAHGRRRSQIIQ